MASPSFRAKANGGGSVAANVTNNVPSGTADDDVMIFVLSKDDTAAVTWPGGWNIIIEMTQNSAYLGVAWRRASSEPASYTWNFSSVWRDSLILSYQGAATAAQASNPLDPETTPSTTSGTGVSNVTVTPPDIVTTTTDTVALAIGAHTAITAWGGAPATWTQREAAANEPFVDEKAIASAGTVTGPGQTSASSSTGAYKGLMIAIQSLPDDQHYFPPAVFPGVFNLDARRMI